MIPPLPIEQVLPDLLAALAKRPNAVVVAPPGAGKTTAIAPALLSEPWCTGEILLLSPRRLAARAAAERMAALAGEPVGRTFGYATRLDSKRCSTKSMNAASTAISASRSRWTRKAASAPIFASSPCPPRWTARASPR